MAQKCVHKGCGRMFTDPEEDCVFHPGPPVFHEGQKGWKCCKPRYLTFDEFLSIPPCTTGKHSTVDDTPKPDPPQPSDIPKDIPPPPPKPIAISRVTGKSPVSRAPVAAAPAAPPPAPPESDSDDPSTPIPPNTSCRRKGCDTTSPAEPKSSREGEQCVHHPGHPLFHEGSKGWTCCKRRVLEFDEFMKIEGCRKKDKHLFVGSQKGSGEEEKVAEVRHDFYQTSTSVIASVYLKKIDKERASVDFSSTSATLDLPTADNKRYQSNIPLFGRIDPENSKAKILGTKLELTLTKLDGLSWPTLRSDEQRTSEIIQVGRAGRA